MTVEFCEIREWGPRIRDWEAKHSHSCGYAVEVKRLRGWIRNGQIELFPFVFAGTAYHREHLWNDGSIR
jgi:hypothetical protein